MTPRRKAELLRLEQQYQCERSNLGSQEGRRAVENEANIVIQEMERELNCLNDQGFCDFECEATSHACVLRGDHVGMIVRWTPPTGNLSQESFLKLKNTADVCGSTAIRRDKRITSHRTRSSTKSTSLTFHAHANTDGGQSVKRGSYRPKC